jgi:four helix bundle protein
VVYTIIKGFSDDERFGLANQMRKSVISVSSNIVEGSYRTTGKGKSNFMTIASLDLKYINERLYLNLRSDRKNLKQTQRYDKVFQNPTT